MKELENQFVCVTYKDKYKTINTLYGHLDYICNDFIIIRNDDIKISIKRSRIESIAKVEKFQTT